MYLANCNVLLNKVFVGCVCFPDPEDEAVIQEPEATAVQDRRDESSAAVVSRPAPRKPAERRHHQRPGHPEQHTQGGEWK